jgi:hypothetical protein
VEQLLKKVKVTQGSTLTAGAAATTDINGSAVDMSNYQGLLIEVAFGTIVTNAVTKLIVQQSPSSSFSGTPSVLKEVTVADDDDDKTFLIDVYKPQQSLGRYVRVVVDRGTQNATVGPIMYTQYDPRTEAQNPAGTGIKSATHLVSPTAA